MWRCSICFKLYVIRGTQSCDLEDCAPLIVVDCGIVHTVACLVNITVSKSSLFRERFSAHTKIVAVVQNDTAQSAWLSAAAFLPSGNPQNNFHIPWNLCFWKHYTGQKTKRHLVAQGNYASIANFRTFSAIFRERFWIMFKNFCARFLLEPLTMFIGTLVMKHSAQVWTMEFDSQ